MRVCSLVFLGLLIVVGMPANAKDRGTNVPWDLNEDRDAIKDTTTFSIWTSSVDPTWSMAVVRLEADRFGMIMNYNDPFICETPKVEYRVHNGDGTSSFAAFMWDTAPGRTTIVFNPPDVTIVDKILDTWKAAEWVDLRVTDSCGDTTNIHISLNSFAKVIDALRLK